MWGLTETGDHGTPIIIDVETSPCFLANSRFLKRVSNVIRLRVRSSVVLAVRLLFTRRA